MNQSPSPQNSTVPVVCRVCKTRSFARLDQVGQHLVCPDCHTQNVVKPPPAAVPRKPAPFTGDEYRLADVDAAPPEQDLVKVVCGTCFTLMHTRAENVGKRLRCPDCQALTVVPRVAPRAKTFAPPDSDDVMIEDAPPPLIDEKRKEFADRLLAEATEHVRRHDADRPKPPRAPLSSGIYSFPCYWNVLPLWIGMSCGILLILEIFDALIDVINAGGLASIMAAFLAPILTLSTFGLLALVAPHYLTIIELSADGFDRIPEWPSQDLLSRLRAVLLGINALAMATLPGMLVVTPFRPWGLPLWCGFISTVCLFPAIVLSMLENDSVFLPYSRLVFRTLRTQRAAWEAVYLQLIACAVAVLVVDFLAWQVNSVLSRPLTVVSVCLYSMIAARLIGRLAWVLGQTPVDDFDEADESPAQDPRDESTTGAPPPTGAGNVRPEGNRPESTARIR